jgi:hypothetical protein
MRKIKKKEEAERELENEMKGLRMIDSTSKSCRVIVIGETGIESFPKKCFPQKNFLKSDMDYQSAKYNCKMLLYFPQ